MTSPHELEEQLKSKIDLFKVVKTKEGLEDLQRVLSLMVQNVKGELKGEVTKNLNRVNKELKKFFDAEKGKMYIGQLNALVGEKQKIYIKFDILPRFDEAYSITWDKNLDSIKKLSPLLNKFKKVNQRIRGLIRTYLKATFSGFNDEAYNKIEHFARFLKAEDELIDKIYPVVRNIIKIYQDSHATEVYVKTLERDNGEEVHKLMNSWIDKLKESFHIGIHELHVDLQLLLDEAISKIVYKPDFKKKNVIWPQSTDPSKHVVLIPTMNRPGYLDRALNDLFENANKYQYPISFLHVIVIDDSYNASIVAQNRRVIAKLKKKKFPITYVSKTEQINFIDTLVTIVGQESRRFFYHDGGSAKGFGGIRNVLSVFALYYGTPDSLITYIDDDTTLKNLSFIKGRSSMAFEHKFNYFGYLDRIFSHKEVQMVGGLVTFDLYEGPIVVFHLLRALRTFFYFASGKDPKTTSIKRISDELVGKKSIQRNINLDKGLAWLAKFCSQARRFGAYRLPCVVYDERKPLVDLGKPNDWLGGANISLKYNTIVNGVPYVLVNWRGEDIIWSKMMAKLLGGGVYRANIPIGHIRGESDRNILEEFGQDLGYYASEQILNILLPKNHMSKNAIINGLKEAAPDAFKITKNIFKKQDAKKDYAYFSAWLPLINQVKGYIGQDEWWGNQRYHRRITEIEAFLNTMSHKDLVKTIQQHCPSPEEITGAIKGYSRLIEMWPTVIEAVKKLKVENGKDIWKREHSDTAGYMGSQESEYATLTERRNWMPENFKDDIEFEKKKSIGKVKRLIILGHAHGGAGEVTVAKKFKTLSPIKTRILQAYDYFDGEKNLWRLSDNNWTLATSQGRIISQPEGDVVAENASEKLDKQIKDGDVVMLLTWEHDEVGILRSGITHKYPVIFKTYVFQNNVPKKDLMIPAINECQLAYTESPLGSIKLAEYGVPKEKIILFPPTYPKIADHLIKMPEHVKKDQKVTLIHEIAARMRKKIENPENATLVCSFGRFIPTKNIDKVIQAFREIQSQIPNAILLVKGTYADDQTPDSFMDLVKEVWDEPWFLFDEERTPFEEIMFYYNSVDLFVSMTGSEGASNAIAEIAALGKPIMMLNASTNPYLYNNMCVFVESASIVQEGRWTYGIPNMNDLKSKLIGVINSEDYMNKIGKIARKITLKRFSLSSTTDRIDLAVRAALAYKNGTEKERKTFEKLIREKFDEDLKLFRLS